MAGGHFFKTMKFIIFINSRIRHGQSVRHPDFSYNAEHQKYIYGGRALTADEFNDAAARVFSEKYQTKGFVFSPMVVKEVEATAPPVEAPPEPPEPPAPPASDTPPATETSQPRRSRAFRKGDQVLAPYFPA